LNPSTRRALLLLAFVAFLLGPAGRCAAKSADLGFALALGPEEAPEGGESPRALVYKVINFVILVGALGFVLRKPLSEFFVQRTASVRKSLDEGRKALEASAAQLREVQEKLGGLEEEIQDFKAAAAREMQAERQRLRQTSAEEAEKILEAARAQIETATRAGRLELKQYAAQEALRLAEELIRERLDGPSRRRLVSRFVDELTVDR
jgi:F0F1-type ATP synthase membrane subunit b/b'